MVSAEAETQIGTGGREQGSRGHRHRQRRTAGICRTRLRARHDEADEFDFDGSDLLEKFADDFGTMRPFSRTSRQTSNETFESNF